MIHFDTSFVVDFSRDDPGPATALLDSRGQRLRGCELLAGAALAQRSDEERRKVREFCATLRIAYPDDRRPRPHLVLKSSRCRRPGENPLLGVAGNAVRLQGARLALSALRRAFHLRVELAIRAVERVLDLGIRLGR
ncbi:MAG TPA: hypothetical protein VOA80_16905 [Thermoanaerobaculia bacterium]|nr:hypothetical protein [Thermoanaerobaculia bacterium]